MKKISSVVSVLMIVLFVSFFCISCSPISMAAIGVDVGLKLLSPDASNQGKKFNEIEGSRIWDPGKKKYYKYDENHNRVYQ